MGADAVVMQENTEIKDGALILSHPVRCGDHLRHRAEDMAVGACVVPSGTRLAPQHIAAIASAGWAEVRVASRLRIGLLVTGSEIHEAGQDIGGGQSGAIWDSNTPMLQASLDPANTVLTDIERVPDTHEAVQAAFARLAGRVDLIVTTGGISVGEEDHVKPALVRQGGQIGFSGVAVKPGKPVSFGTLGPTYWLGLPGNPQAAFVMWHLFGTLLIDRMLGAVCAVPKRQMAVLASDLHHKPGRCELRLAHHTGHDGLGRQTVQSETGTHSGRVGVLAQATGVILIPAETRHLPAGALVDYHPLSCL
ncbi:MAG: molybdopterin molybdotransferase MoeA [Paracoccaceae bacterium]